MVESLTSESFLSALIAGGVDSLREEDGVLYDLLRKEHERQANTLSLVASSSVAHPSVLVCEGSPLVNVTAEGIIDYEQVRRLAREHRPKLIICGTTAYSRAIDFERFRRIADEVNALLLADITHIAGLVAAGIHPSPVDHAHFTTTCTHKQL